jgi:hypothetical protein
MQSKTLIVVGMHRSGTSLITNWLNRCGLQIGESLLGDAPSNVDGHFEDLEFLKIHQEILESNNLPSSGLIDDDNKKIDISIYQMEKLKSIINIKNKLYTQWGWKDPRTCLFLDTYRELFSKSKYLVIVRDYPSVINSLLKRDFAEIERKYEHRGFFTRKIWAYFKRNRRKQKFYSENAEYYLKVWIAYNEHILNMLKDLLPEDYVVLNYSLLKECDRKIFTLLTDTWGFALRYFSFNDVFKGSLLSKPIDLNPYINNKALLSEAESLENAFKPYINAC